MNKHKHGFTLIELLVVVIIIAVLAAVAVPQYKKAVLKSRFSTVMPLAKSLASANEVYYLGNGYYAQNPTELDVDSKDTTEEAYPEGTRVLMYDNAGLSYVRATNDNVPNARYIVYQKHSANFADTTMCEAKDEQANALCIALGGQVVEGGNSSGESNWTAYLLTGSYGSTDQFAVDSGDDSEDDSGNDTQTPTCNEDEKPNDIEVIVTNIKRGIATCDTRTGKWKYEWTGIRVYDTDYKHSTIVCESRSTAYACAGNEYQGKSNGCQAETEGGCAYSTFSGYNSFCKSGDVGNGCTGSIFTGQESNCGGTTVNGCMGAIIQAGAYCGPISVNGCAGVLYGADPTGNNHGMGSCRDNWGNCPTGVPIFTNNAWNATNGSYDIKEWKGGYCDATAMVTGVCPNGAPTGSATTTTDKTTAAGWYGGYCDPLISGTCPSGSPKEGGGTW